MLRLIFLPKIEGFFRKTVGRSGVLGILMGLTVTALLASMAGNAAGLTIAVNRKERAIRKQVVEHMSLRGEGANIPASLVLMSVVKDAERIGDY